MSGSRLLPPPGVVEQMMRLRWRISPPWMREQSAANWCWCLRNMAATNECVYATMKDARQCATPRGALARLDNAGELRLKKEDLKTQRHPPRGHPTQRALISFVSSCLCV